MLCHYCPSPADLGTLEEAWGLGAQQGDREEPLSSLETALPGKLGGGVPCLSEDTVWCFWELQAVSIACFP